MLELFQDLPSGGAVHELPRWSMFKLALTQRVSERHSRFFSTEPKVSALLRLLENLIFSLDVDELLKLDDLVDVFFYIKEKEVALAQIYDIGYTKVPRKRTFIHDRLKSSLWTPEILVNTSYSNPTRSLTFNEKEIVNDEPALRVLACATPELVRGLQGDHLVYTTAPDYFVASINLVSVAIKWLAYIKKYTKTPTLMQNPREFIHAMLIAPLEDQCVDLWLLTVINTVLQAPTLDKIDEYVDLFCTEYNTAWVPKNAFREGLKDIVMVCTRLTRQQTTVPAFLNTGFFTGKKTIFDLTRNISEFHAIPDNRWYGYVKFLSEAIFLEFIIRTLAMRPVDQYMQGFRNRLPLLFSILQSQQVFSVAPMVRLRRLAEDKFNELANLLPYQTHSFQE